MTENKYYELVYNAIHDCLALEREGLNPKTDIVNDLQADSDDITFLLIPYLQEKISNKIPNEKWLEVSTIEEISELLKKYDRSRE